MSNEVSDLFMFCYICDFYFFINVEHLFLRLRAASVGEKIKVKVTCPDDNRTEVVKEINLADIDSTFDVTHSNISTVASISMANLKPPYNG